MDFVKLLSNEVIATYITFIAGVVFAIAGFLIRSLILKRKPSIIRVEKSFEGSLLDIGEDARDKLKITYQNIEIPALFQAIFTVKNIGEVPIENIELHFYFKEISFGEILQITVTNEDEIQEVSVLPEVSIDFEVVANLQEGYDDPEKTFCVVGFSDNAIGLRIPFLNPWKEYEDYIGLTVLAIKPLDIDSVTGKGLGWSTVYYDFADLIKRLTNITVSSTSPLWRTILWAGFLFKSK